MVDAHIKLYEETGMDIVKIMQDYAYPISGEIKSAQDWRRIKVKGTDSEEFAKMASDKNKNYVVRSCKSSENS